MSAKYEYRRSVTHCCGHRQNHTFHARCRQEADSWASNLRKVECDACKENVVEKVVEDGGRSKSREPSGLIRDNQAGQLGERNPTAHLQYAVENRQVQVCRRILSTRNTG